MMDKRESIPMPTEAERNRAIASILDTGLPQAEPPRAELWRRLYGLSPSVLFFGVGDRLFLAVLLTALCLVPTAAAAARQVPLAPLLFLLSPLLYTLLQLLTIWKDSMSGTFEWKQTCRISFRMLTSLRMLLFGGTSVAVCVPMNVLLWNASNHQLALPWMLGLSFSSLFLHAALSLFCQRSRRQWAPFAAPLLWAILGVFLLRWQRACVILSTVPALVFFLLAIGSLCICLSELKHYILRPVEGGSRHAVR